MKEKGKENVRDVEYFDYSSKMIITVKILTHTRVIHLKNQSQQKNE